MDVTSRLYPDSYIDVDGVRTRYWEAGAGDRTVVLVHGLGGAVENWAGNMEALSGRFRVVALDMIGFGRTDKPDGAYTYRFFAAFLDRFFRAKGIGRAAVFGHSLGGGIALQFTVDFPDRVERLVLVGSGGLSPEFALALRILTLPGIGEILARPARRTARQMLTGLTYDPTIGGWDAIADRFNEMAFLPGTRKAMLRTLRANATVWGGTKSALAGIVPFLGSVRQKTLLVWGRQDAVVPFRASQVALERMPDARLIAFDDCGHAPMFERQDEFNRDAVAFLGEP